MYIDRSKTYIGIVEDNEDPKKLSRVRVRVLDVFDEIPTGDIPWASPWKDLNGNSVNIPEKGKVLTIIFDQGNIYKPEYIYAEHFNINLEKKLQTLSNKDYTSMKALLFDHKTQIYSNDSEGLKLDYKFNNLNITDSSIDINLKDNKNVVNIGSSIAGQQAILGNHFLNWFDEFLQVLLASPYLTPSGTPVTALPPLIATINKFKSLKDPKFLSHHINLVDNNYVIKQDRISDGQVGDSWISTIQENKLSNSEKVSFKPSDGNSTDNPDAILSTTPSIGSTPPPFANETPPGPLETENEDINIILKTMKDKGYTIYDKPFEMNIIGIRKQYEGMQYSNKFIDDCYLIYKDEGEKWQSHKYKITTIPGFYLGDERSDYTDSVHYDTESSEIAFVRKGSIFKDTGVVSTGNINNKQSIRIKNRGGLVMLKPSQMINTYYLSTFLDFPALKTNSKQPIYRDKTSDDIITYSAGKNSPDWGGDCYFHIAMENTLNVDNWSEGSQVFQTKKEAKHFMDLCAEHTIRHRNSFTYTLMEERDLLK
jgi:hypothetical protein